VCARATSRAGFCDNFHALSAAHGLPVVGILCCAHKADLVVVAILTTARPGKLVGTTAYRQYIHKLLRHQFDPGACVADRSMLNHERQVWVGYHRSMASVLDAAPGPVEFAD
jgi:hypothetical protein